MRSINILLKIKIRNLYFNLIIKYLLIFILSFNPYLIFAGNGFTQCFPSTSPAHAPHTGPNTDSGKQEEVKFNLNSFMRKYSPSVIEKDYLFKIKDIKVLQDRVWQGAAPRLHHNAMAQGNVDHLFVRRWVTDFFGRLDSKQMSWTTQFIKECEVENSAKINLPNYNWRMLACFSKKISETTRQLATHNNGFFDEELFRTFCTLAAKLFEVTVDTYQKQIEQKYGKFQKVFRVKVYTYVAPQNQCSMHVYNRIRVYIDEDSFPANKDALNNKKESYVGGLRPFYYAIDVGNRPNQIYPINDVDASQVVSCEASKINRLAGFVTHPNLDFPWMNYISWYSGSSLRHFNAIQVSLKNGNKLTEEQQLPFWTNLYKSKTKLDFSDWNWVREFPNQLKRLGLNAEWFEYKLDDLPKREGAVRPPPAYFAKMCTND